MSQQQWGAPQAGPVQRPAAPPAAYAQPSYPGPAVLPPPQQPRGPGARSVLVLVAAALVCVAALGALLWALFFNRPAQGATIAPQTPTIPVQTDPTDTGSAGGATPTPDASPTAGPGDRVEVAQGISVTVPEGWRVDQSGSRAGAVMLTNGDAAFMATVFSNDRDSSAQTLVESYVHSVGDKMQGAQYGTTRSLDVGSSKVDVATSQVEGTVVQGGQSQRVGLYPMVSVRTADGVSVLGALIAPPEEAETYAADYRAMTLSLIRSQVAG